MSDDDVEVDCGEELVLPPTVPSLEAEIPARTPIHERIGDRANQETEVDSFSFNAYAAEFIPTFSMACPVVGYCDVIVEGDEETATSDVVFLPAHCAAPLAEPLLESQSKAMSSKKNFFREKRPQALQVATRAPVLSDSDRKRRLRTIEVVKETQEYQFCLERRRLCGEVAEPLTPDASDATLSKRSWDHTVRAWRTQLRTHYHMFASLEEASLFLEMPPKAASVASTEAEEADEADDSTVDRVSEVNSDDASSAHWSSS